MLIQAQFMRNLLRDFFVPCRENGFKPRVLETQFFFILLGLLVGLKILALVSFWGNFGANIFNQVSQDDLYVLTNQARTANGVGKLQISSRLEAVAQLKLSDMLQNNYFAHISPAGINPWYWFGKANYNYLFAGENLAMNFMSSDEVVRAWLNSESHKKNLLLNDFKETGIAVGSGVLNGQETVVVVQVFGMPKTPVLAVQTKSTPKVTPSTTPTPIPPGGLVIPTTSITPIPSLTPKITSTPKPAPVVKASPVSLKKVAVANPQVKSAVEDGRLLPDYLSSFAGDSFKEIMILFVAIATLILFLKVFVAFRVQFPSLIFRAILLIAISLSFVLINDEDFFLNRIQITDKAEITISNAK